MNPSRAELAALYAGASAFVFPSWIEGFGITEKDLVEEDTAMLATQIEEETGRQIRHNLDAGLIKTAETEEVVRYSWRGLIYLYFQLVKDMVRMA